MFNCTHHWLIESPNGQELVRGVCKKCGSVMMFKSQIEFSSASPDSEWLRQKRKIGIEKIRRRESR